MANSTSIIDYMGEGLASARPTTPPVSSAALAFYYSTDTTTLDLWNGSAWVAVAGSGSSGANPTATASDTAVNGTATTFLRSDGAPAVQKASSSQFGIVKVDGTTITASAGVISSVGGGGGGTLPTVRGSGIQTVGTSTMTVAWPSGTLAGDLAIIFTGSDFFPTIPSGWTVLDANTGPNWEGVTIAKVLTSGDITAGAVVVTFGGTGGAVGSIITFDGATAGVFGLQKLWSGTSGTSSQLSLPSDSAGGLGVYFASSRANQTITISNGTQIQTISSSPNTASGVLNTGAMTTPIFNNFSTATYPGGNTGFYHVGMTVIGP